MEQQLSFLLIVIASLSLITGILAVVALVKSLSANKKLALLLSGGGKDAKNLEEIIIGHTESLKEVDKDIQELFEISNKIHKLAFRGLHKTGLIRFNPFKDVGGNQSFSLALLDGHNSGIIFTSLHTREGNHVYIKPVVKGISEKYPLTEEEKKAISSASPIKETTLSEKKKTTATKRQRS